jgi:hypothetical protein
MTIQRLCTRVKRLEQHAQAQRDGVLHVWRLPDESAAEALARCAINPEDYPQVQVHVWVGGRVAARLATPPSPCWIPRQPDIAELERRLQEGMQQREAGQRCTD